MPRMASQLLEKLQPLRALDHVRIGDRIGSAGKEIGQADRIPDIGRHDGQRQVEGTGNLLQNIAQQRAPGGTGLRGDTLSDFETAFHSLFPVTGTKGKLSITIKEVCAGLGRRKPHPGGFAVTDVLFDGDASVRLLQKEIVRDKEGGSDQS
jgi:hypothetical protein